ncbi:MAG: DUF2461 domain-containing protein [Bacteroidetes bacterium]|nr:DUF2461 domain-containing protein [Bacteroidota bacterium]MBL6942914.1 DUF2461 domain-containing protein [Bacteroidales bacterium]
MGTKVIKFLSELKENNDRDWFNSNKKYFEEAKREFTDMVDYLIPALAVTNPLMSNLEAKEAIFRIYRDVRFSKDKSPYKTAMGAFLAPGGRKSMLAGNYFHIEPGNSFLAGGSHCPPNDQLKKIRSEIYHNNLEFNSIINSSDFLNLFGEIKGDKLVRPPAGFPKDFEDIELLKLKDYTIFYKIEDEEIAKP